MDEPKKERTFHYFVDGVKYETQLSSITGAEIKAKIPNFNPSYSLYLEERGGEPDKLITDTDSVSLEDGAKHFHTVPPASFGKK